MILEEQLLQRSENKCELCQSEEQLKLYEVPPQSARNEDNCIMICETCASQIEKRAEVDKNHWRCLSSSMWSEVPGVQVVAWRMLQRLSSEGWASDNLDMLYLDDERLAWAKAVTDDEDNVINEMHKDANGMQLQAGDSIVLTRSLDVKGSQLNAKMGTVVKNIRLVENNTDQIEGKIEGQMIVILTKYVRKQA
ncbi:putative phnA protein [Pedobacter sp. BAL39]|uniref:PhnA domain-containing protein n=1 Tax=Pedobacter sp. BAL39 TaxID=391596 RepID=UPI000155A6A8|nr:alkylphosphonate utilization protein [Pedobacter sp. BAL39]EDM34840.1 putative phnA protein [Pedobacter sp. BAL39]